MNKKLIIAIIAIGSISANTFAIWGLTMSSSATQANTVSSSVLPTSPQVPGMNRAEYKKHMMDMKEKWKEKVWEFRKWIKEKRGEMLWKAKELRNQYKPEIRQAWKKLDNNVKQKIQDVRKEYAPKFKALREKFQNATKEQRKLLKEQMLKLRTELHNQIKTVAWDTDFVKNMEAKRAEIEKHRKYMLDHIKMERENFKQVRATFKEARQSLVVKWKKMIIAKLSSRIDKMSLARLEKIQAKIEKAIPAIQNRKNLSEDKKAEIMSALDALKQVVNERISQLKTETSSEDTMNVLNDVLGE